MQTDTLGQYSSQWVSLSDSLTKVCIKINVENISGSILQIVYV